LEVDLAIRGPLLHRGEDLLHSRTKGERKPVVAAAEQGTVPAGDAPPLHEPAMRGDAEWDSGRSTKMQSDPPF
jgi:hypothetical protein